MPEMHAPHPARDQPQANQSVGPPPESRTISWRWRTQVEPLHLLEYSFGGRTGRVEFADAPAGVTVTVTFDTEDTYSEEQQRAGWQAILDSFARYVVAAIA